MSTYVDKVKSLQSEINKLKLQDKSACADAQKELSKLGYIASYGSIKLYYDRIEGTDRTLKIDSGIEAAAQVDGTVYATTNVSGGGSRPTLTRIAVGACVAGPLGALIGGAAQKKKKIKTSNEVHDLRTYRVIVTGKEGYIEATKLSPTPDPQTFVGKIINAIADYPKDKDYYDAKRKELQTLINNSPYKQSLKEKQAELNDLINGASDKEKNELAKYNKRQNIITGSIGIMAIGVAVAVMVYIGIYFNNSDKTYKNSSYKNTESVSSSTAIDEHLVEYLKECTVMEMADNVNISKYDKETAYRNARNFCESNLSSWGEADFTYAVENDWDNRKNELLYDTPLSTYIQTLNWD